MRRTAMGLLALMLALAWTGAARAASDEDQIDEVITQFWQTFKTGDLDAMSKYVAEDVSAVSGLYQPPLEGWTNVRQSYKKTLDALENINFTRDNTRIKVRGKFAWASHQWVMTFLADRQPRTSAGQTTFVFEKRGGRWLIVHIHSSLVPTGAMQAPQPANPGR